MKASFEQMHLKSVTGQPVEPRAAIAGSNYGNLRFESCVWKGNTYGALRDLTEVGPISSDNRGGNGQEGESEGTHFYGVEASRSVVILVERIQMINLSAKRVRAGVDNCQEEDLRTALLFMYSSFGQVFSCPDGIEALCMDAIWLGIGLWSGGSQIGA
jgi:hypothetical protein